MVSVRGVGVALDGRWADTDVMRKRGWVIVSAVLLALGVLGASWLWGGSAPLVERGPGDVMLNLPEQRDSDGRATGSGEGPQIKQITGPRYTREDGPRITTFGADRLQPQAEFVFDADQPFARIATGRSKLLIIEAAHGIFYLPGNEPQRGEFSSDVVVSFYESPDGAVNTADPTHLKLRAFLDDKTTFDRDLGQLRSDGPVHVTGPGFDFKGTGLVALYNQSLERIDRLTIAKGEHLRFARAQANRGDASPGVESSDAIDAATPAQATSDTSASAPVATGPATPTSVAPLTPQAADASPLYYRADFTQDVFVVAGPDQGTLAGDALSVFFAAGALSDAPRADHPTRSASDALGFARSLTQHQLISVDAARASRSLMPIRDDDVVVTWSGPLVLDPVSAMPVMLAGAAADAQLLLMRGSDASPVRGQSGPSDRFTASAVEYLTSPRRLRAQGSDALPLTFQSQQHGTATGQTLDSDLDAGTTTMTGPGRLEGTADQPFTIAFNDRMNLRFTNSTSPALTRAEFLGDVTAAGPADRATPDATNATAQAQQVIVDFKPDPADTTRTTPDTLTMLGSATAQQADQSIRADRILARVSPSNTAASEQPQDRLALARIEADGKVLVEALDSSGEAPRKVTLRADRLVAEPPQNTLDLIGTPDQPATLEHPDATLTGTQIALTDAPQTLRVPSAGTLTAPLDPANPDSRLTLAWSEAFTYDDATRTAIAIGNVDATTTSPTDDTSLGCDRLELLLSSQTTSNDNAVGLRRAHATMKPEDADTQVHFAAQSFDPATPNKPLTRLTLYGRQLIFTNEPTSQTVVVPTAGKTLIEDYRTNTSNSATSDVTAKPQVAMSGRGVTLMEWADKLTLDLVKNDLQVNGRLFINHDPLDGQGRVQLYGQSLSADLIETGGLGAWTGNAAPKPQLRTVTVQRDVVITHKGVRIDADTLRYLGESQTVHLLADAGKTVTVVDPKSRAPQSAEAFTWDLLRNRLSATRTTGGTVPLE